MGEAGGKRLPHAGNARHDGRRPHGHDGRVRRKRGHGLARGLDARAHVHRRARELKTQVVAVGQVLLLVRRRRHDAELAADLALALEQHDLVPTARRGERRLDAAGAAARDDHALLLARRRDATLELVAELGVDGALGTLALPQRMQTVVAAKALTARQLTAIALHQVGVGDPHAPEAKEVGLARLEHGLHARRVVQAVLKDAGLLDRSLKAREVLHVGRVVVVARRHDVGLVVIVADAQLVGVHEAAALELAGHLDLRVDRDARARRHALGQQVVHIHAENHGVIAAHLGAHGLEGLDEESHALGGRAAVLVGSLVPCRREELVNEVAALAHDEQAVEAGALQASRRRGVGADHVRDLGLGHLAGAQARVILGLALRGRDGVDAGLRGVVVAARAHGQLAADLCPVDVDHVGRLGELLDALVSVDERELHVVGIGHDLVLGLHRAGKDKAAAALGARLEDLRVAVRERRVERVAGKVFEVHRRHADAVLEAHRADARGLEQVAVRVPGHAHPLRRLTSPPFRPLPAGVAALTRIDSRTRRIRSVAWVTQGCIF